MNRLSKYNPFINISRKFKSKYFNYVQKRNAAAAVAIIRYLNHRRECGYDNDGYDYEPMHIGHFIVSLIFGMSFLIPVLSIYIQNEK